MLSILLLALSGFGFDTVPQETGDFSDVIYPSQNLTRSQSESSTADARIKLTVGCYGTNLRSVGNPISPASKITATLKLQSMNLNIHFQGSLAASGGGSATVSGVPGATVQTAGRSIFVTIPNHISQTQIRTIKVGDDGDVNESVNVVQRDAMVFKGVSFSQVGVSGGRYYARTGGITNVAFGRKVSNDGTQITATAKFPGQNGFCGGYFSPLMAFFDHERPSFTAITDFPLHKVASQTYWPEANSPGYFVAWDRNGNGKIDKANELFGDSEGDKNGFEAFRHLDKNGDAVIDSKDPLFAKLVLWKDKNANGKSEKEELKPISEFGIRSFSLGYQTEINAIGYRAEERERSTFEYVDRKTGKTKKSDLIDIWLAPYHGGESKIAENDR